MYKDTKPYRSFKLKSVQVNQLKVGDILLHGGSKSGAFHIITVMIGPKTTKTTRILFKTKFYAIIRNGVVIFDRDKYDPIFDCNPYPNTLYEIIDHSPLPPKRSVDNVIIQLIKGINHR